MTSVKASRRSPRSGRLVSAGAEEALDLAVLRPAAHRLLREDELAVGVDVELGLRSLADRRVDPAVLQLGCETRGPLQTGQYRISTATPRSYSRGLFLRREPA
jgi:hypothetical protein